MNNRESTAGKAISFKELTEVNPVGILRIDSSGNIQYANEAAERILDIKKDELTDLTYSDLAKDLLDPGNGLEFDEIRSFRSTEGPKGDGTEPLKRTVQSPKEGGGLLILNVLPLFDGDGGFDGIVLALDETTKSSELEEFFKGYRLPGESTVDPMAACDTDYNYLFANQAYMGLYKVTREELYDKKV